MAAAYLKAPRVGHATARARERYGINLSKDDLYNIARRIQTNQGTLVRRLDNGRSEWVLRWLGKNLRIIMDASLYYVVTALPSVEDAPYTPPPRGPRKLWRKGEQVWVR